MTQTRFKFEHLLYLAAFLLAIVIRLAGADRMTLTDREATLALQALALAKGQAALPDPHPAYLILTALMMYIFNAGNWVARFWPALAGSLLVLVPALFRSRLGRLPAALLALFLALDPGLLAVSRQAGSLSLALFFTMLALGVWLNGRPVLAGVAAGMALLSGPQFWPGLIGLGLAAWAASRLNRPPEAVSAAPAGAGTNAGAPQGDDGPRLKDAAGGDTLLRRGAIVRALIFAAATVFFAGTLFFFLPDGLGALAGSLPAYLRGWAPSAPGVTASGAATAAPSAGVPLGLLLAALLAYELFPLVFGLWGGLAALARRAPRQFALVRFRPVDRFLLVWWAIALVLALIPPGRQVTDLAWSLLPLWGLAARQAARLVSAPSYDRLPMLGQMALAAVILGYISMVLVSNANGAIASPWEYRVRLFGAIIMLAASAGLIAWGWSRRVALRGASWGLGILLLVYMLSAGWNAVGLSGRSGEELWSGAPRFAGAGLLRETLGGLDQLSMPKQVNGLDLVVVGTPSPALQWLLRSVPRISYASQVPNNSSPSLVITREGVSQGATGNATSLALASTYRGQSFILGENVAWSQFQAVDWFRWLVFRSASAAARQQEQIILWARTDLFPGGTANK